jgi:hypothetical protein
MGFGGFLLGLGVGWYVFRYITADVDMIGYLLILAGVGIIINAFLSRGRRRSPIQGLFGGLIGGLFLALFLTQGFGIVNEITDEFIDIDLGTYRATRTYTLDTPVTAESLTLDVENVNGGIDVSSWSGDHVKFDIEVKARGSTTAEAEANLDRFTHSLEDSVSGTTQRISLNFSITSSEWSNYAVIVDVYVPEGVADEISLQTTNGEISVQGLSPQELMIDTTNGKVSLTDVEASVIQVETTNGIITGTVTSPSTSFSTHQRGNNRNRYLAVDKLQRHQRGDRDDPGDGVGRTPVQRHERRNRPEPTHRRQRRVQRRPGHQRRVHRRQPTQHELRRGQGADKERGNRGLRREGDPDKHISRHHHRQH